MMYMVTVEPYGSYQGFDSLEIINLMCPPRLLAETLNACLCRPNIAVARLEVSEGRIVLVNADRAVSCHKWIAPRPDSTFTFAKAGELAYGVEADSTAPRSASS